MKYHARIRGFKTNILDLITDKEKLHILTSLEEAAWMLNSTGVDWYLIGSLGLSIHHNSSLKLAEKTIQKEDKIQKKEGKTIDTFFDSALSANQMTLIRLPSNINIEVDRKELQLLLDGMKSHGYEMHENIGTVSFPRIPNEYLKFSQYLSKLSNTKAGLYHKIDSKINESKKYSRPLILIKEKDSDNPLLSCIDVAVKSKTESKEGTIIYHNGKPITINKQYYGKTVMLGEEKIKLRNLHYLRHLKTKSKNAKDVYDMSFIFATLYGKMSEKHDEKVDIKFIPPAYRKYFEEK